MKRVTFLFQTVWLVLSLAVPPASGEDWPTYMKDNARSGVTGESLPHLSRLREAWVYESPAPPRVAWDGGAPWDAWRSSSVQNTCALTPMRDFDFVLFVSVSGNNLYFGSSVTDSVHCLDKVTGEERWFFTTEGAVRYPPSVDEGRLFFGSDDGHVYCIDGEDGSFIWKYTPSGETRLIGNNGGSSRCGPSEPGPLLRGARSILPRPWSTGRAPTSAPSTPGPDRIRAAASTRFPAESLPWGRS